jgi:hypothetical protein
LRLRDIFEELKPQSGTQHGSNPGAVHVDTETGEQHYVKWYHDPDQGRVEALASKIYEHMGIKTVSPQVMHVGGREAVVSKWNHDLVQKRPHEWDHVTESQAHQVGRLYHAAVLTKNWDIVGLNHDNILQHKDTGDVHAIDHGGAFHFRAQGGPKEYGSDIDEHHTFRYGLRGAPSTSIAPTARLFGNTFQKYPRAEHEGLKPVREMDMDRVHRMFRESGLKNWESLHTNFVARRQKLLSHYGQE